MRKRIIIWTSIMLVLAIGLGVLSISGFQIGKYVMDPLPQQVDMGLDLTGGVSIVYRAVDTSVEDFNEKMQTKLSDFIERLQESNYTFSCVDFREFDVSALTENSLVYCDPPYLVTCATYNEQDGWNEQTERDLLDLLYRLNENCIKFALSNVLTSKGKTNTILAEWLGQRDYRTIHLDYSYSNSNYHTKDKTDSTD